MTEIIICIIYLWYCFSVFFTRTYGSFVYMGLIILQCGSLIASVTLYMLKSSTFYLLIPIIPHCLCIYWDNLTRKRLGL